MDCIYLDNNSTTQVLPAVWQAMRPYFTDVYGNPASAHQLGRRARQALEDARDRVASLLGAHPDEVIFTSGATEANNLALFSHAGAAPGHLMASLIEHPSATEPIRCLQVRGFAVDWLPIDPEGVVRTEAVKSLQRPDTRLVAVMLANHETGALQPIRILIELLGGGTAFHCDAVQAVGKMPVHFHELGVTTLSLSAHKFHGPKGIGALLVRRGVKLVPNLWGGHQQRGRRPGTEAVALAVGLATALDLAHRECATRTEHVRKLRGRLVDRLRSSAEPVILNGSPTSGMPHTLNISFPGLRADAVLMALDLAGVACSTGSACSSGSLLPSPVLQAMGIPDARLHSAMRFSLSALLTEDQIDEAARRIASVVVRLRNCDPD